MKNQFFGDRRDLFKYDLLLEVIGALPQLKRLTLVPMLTPNVPSAGGGLTTYERDGFRGDVYDFLKQRIAAGARSVRELPTLFGGRQFEYVPYADDVVFDGPRAAYFAGIPDDALKSSLVFFDPDNGLEPRGRPTRGHLLYGELASVMQRADEASVSVVFQFFAREQRDTFFKRLTQCVGTALPGRITIAVHDDNLAFLLVLRSSHMTDLLRWLPGYVTGRGLRTWPAGAAKVQAFQLDRPHFGYGSNMCDPWLRLQAPSAKARGAAHLTDYVLGFDKESGDCSAKATIAPLAGRTTPGVLFDIEPADLSELNTKEGGYLPLQVTVTQVTGEVPAWTYVPANPGTRLLPFDWYVDLMIAGATHHGLPDDHIEAIRRAPRATGTDSERAKLARCCIEEFESAASTEERNERQVET